MSDVPFVPTVEGWSYERIVEHYRESGGEFWRNTRVWRRSEIDNTDPTLYRRGRCICGQCGGDDRICACGMDTVVHGRHCITCGRPWWCER